MCFEDPCRHPDLEGSLRPFATPPERTAGFAPTELQLNRLNEKGYNNEPGRGSQYIDQVTALLSAEGLLPMALVRWENSTDQHGVVQSSPAGTDYNHFLRTVELMLDLSPALRAAALPRLLTILALFIVKSCEASNRHGRLGFLSKRRGKDMGRT